MPRNINTPLLGFSNGYERALIRAQQHMQPAQITSPKRSNNDKKGAANGAIEIANEVASNATAGHGCRLP